MIKLGDIDRSCAEYKLFILTRKLVDFCNCEEFEKVDVEDFKELTATFVNKWSLIIGSCKPKVHITSHFSDLLNKFSIFKLYSTVRQERLHQLLKLFVSGSNNYGSLSIQMLTSWAINFLQKSFKVDLKEELIGSYLPEEFQKYIPEELTRLVNNQVLNVYSSIVIRNGLEIKKDSIYLYNYNSSTGLPQFLKVKYIIKQNEIFKIICQPLITIEFLKIIYCFRVTFEQSLRELNVSQVYYKPLIHINISNYDLIIKNFHIPLRYSKVYDN